LALFYGYQCLQYTLGLKKSKWRILDKCHHARNLAEYEGHLDVNSQLLRELVSITEEIQGLVELLARQHKE
jgi:hypothetical protein